MRTNTRRCCAIVLVLLLAACGQADTMPVPRRRAFPTAPPLTAPAATPAPRSTAATPVLPVFSPTAAPDLPASASAWVAQQALPLALDAHASDDDLAGLKKVIGDARIVLIGEPTHGAHEFAQLRVRLTAYLTGVLGFTVHALDAPWGDVAPLNDYVMYSNGDPQRLLGSLADGWNSDETLDMLAWLNAFDRTSGQGAQATLNGVDIGMPAAAMNAIEDFVLKHGDSSAVVQTRDRFACLRPYARTGAGYEALPDQVTSDCRAGLQAVLDDLRANDAYRSDAARYAQALMGAHIVLQSEDLMLLGANPGAEGLRTRFHAENAVALLTPGARVVIWTRTAQADLAANNPKSLAALLREKYGGTVRSIAFSMARGRFIAAPGLLENPGIRTAQPPPAGAYEQAFATAGKSFWLDLREIDPADSGAAWLSEPHLLRAASPDYIEANPATHFAPVSLRRSFDAVFFTPAVTPASTQYSGLAGSSPFGPPRNLDIESGMDGWQPFGVQPGGYVGGADKHASHSGALSLSLAYTGTTPAGRGTLGQTVSAARFRGQRLRVSAYLRTQDVERGAGLAVTLSPVRATTFALAIRDTMEGRAVRGSHDWQRYDVVVDVPNTDMSLAFGVWLDGRGTVWLDDVQLEAVGDDVPTTYALGLPDKPSNLSFADGAAGWSLDANRWSDWTFGVVPDARSGAPAARLASVARFPNGEAFVQQYVNARPYRGKRVRFDGMVRATDMAGGAGLALTASSQRMVWNARSQRLLSGTLDWTPVSVSFDVPDNAEMLHLRLYLFGPGQFWVSGLRLDVVQ